MSRKLSEKRQYIQTACRMTSDLCRCPLNDIPYITH